jgi:hypothetical protein
VEASFKSLARSIMLYEKRWFATWSDSINNVAMQHLKVRGAASCCMGMHTHSELLGNLGKNKT